jgi:hypothetical protein
MHALEHIDSKCVTTTMCISETRGVHPQLQLTEMGLQLGFCKQKGNIRAIDITSTFKYLPDSL